MASRELSVLKYGCVSQAKMLSWWLSLEDLEWPDTDLEQTWQTRAELFADKGANTVDISGVHFRWDYLPILVLFLPTEDGQLLI